MDDKLFDENINYCKIYNNPYSTLCKKYYTFRYLCEKHSYLSFDEKWQWCENRNYNDKIHLPRRPKSIPTEKIREPKYSLINDIDNPNASGIYGITYPKIDILRIDDTYVYYKDKIWSRHMDRFLKSKEDKNGRYVLKYSQTDGKYVNGKTKYVYVKYYF
tara:strand:- start:506 stop:985 length:480 start_codon:yes stop_codon:yes gene_type:complete